MLATQTSQNADSLWNEYHQTRSPRLRDQLIEAHLHLARHAVKRLQITAWGCVSEADLVSHAVIGLIDAVDRYNPEYGIPFPRFAMPRVRGAVLDALRRLDWVPRSVRAQETSLQNTYSKLGGILGRSPSDAEVADYLGISREELDRQLNDVARTSTLSLDDLVAEFGDCVETRGDRGTGDLFHLQARGEARARLIEAINQLPEREKQVLSLYYYYDLTLKEIGKVLEVTEQRVSQIHARAILRLSHKLVRHTELLTALGA
jgi:RNA polymerase sigma factor FliA